ncbi:MAG TPA: hypothetical protein VI935_06165 [Thermodesulfobacteriota bacterium]|nr:hypothetical protein [Thermodesulfobacteriota bacterium]
MSQILLDLHEKAQQETKQMLLDAQRQTRLQLEHLDRHSKQLVEQRIKGEQWLGKKYPNGYELIAKVVTCRRPQGLHNT